MRDRPRLLTALRVRDPGLQRAYLAGRTTLSVGAAVVMAFPLARALDRPLTFAMLVVAVAIVSSVALSGTPRPLLMRTAGVVWALAASAVALGALLAPIPLASYAGFVAMMAGGAWASRYGPRGVAIGIVGVMSYFYTLFTRASVGQIPWLIGAATLGVATALVVRGVVLRDRPARRLRSLLVAVRARAEALAEHRADPRGPEAMRAAAERDSAALDQVVLLLHDLLRDDPGLVPDPRAFQRHLFAVVALSHLLLLQAQLGEEAAEPDPTLALPPTDPILRLLARLDAMEGAAEGREVVIDWDDPPPFEEDFEEGRPSPVLSATPGDGWLSGSARTALQVIVAGALSIVVGLMLSPERWYWATLSAYFVFANTGSRGATVRKALERMIGTGAGIAAGVLLGYLIAGNARAEVIAIPPLLFLAYWMLPVSYAVMVGTVTVVLALLYDLLGMLTVDVLILRLEETVVGAGLGAAVAYFILPTRTRGAVDQAFSAYLGAMDELLDSLARSAGGGGSDAAVLDAAHALDRALATLRGLVRPVVEAVPGRRARLLQQEVTLALAARYWVHRLAARVVFHPGQLDVEELRARIDGVRAGLPRIGARVDVRPPAVPAPAGSAGDPLTRVETVLAELARTRAAAD